MSSVRSIVFHDECVFPGGGERVASAAAAALKARIITGSHKPEAFPGDFFGNIAIEDLGALENPFSRLPFAKTLLMWRAFSALPQLSALPQQSPGLSLFSGNFAPLAVHRVEGPTIFYCHTPPRPVFDLKEYYARRAPLLIRPAHRLLMHSYRKAYVAAVQKMDLVLANSKNVAHRLRSFLGIDAQVLYPPCDTKSFVWKGQEDFYLSTARVDTLKRVDLVVEAFLQMPKKRLLVASGGCELEGLKKKAAHASNVSFTGWLDEDRLRDLMGRCTATLYIPKDEDFGISPLESMAAGKPVIAVQEGGLKETVMDGETGVLVPAEAKTADIVDAVEYLTPERARAMRSACEERAAQFAADIFREKLRAYAGAVIG
jgi:glycosyltransferase involved in cell wall biosynthesis